METSTPLVPKRRFEAEQSCRAIVDRSCAEEVRVGQEEADKKYNDAIDARAEQHKIQRMGRPRLRGI
jgi:hypothetical protein